VDSSHRKIIGTVFFRTTLQISIRQKQMTWSPSCAV